MDLIKDEIVASIITQSSHMPTSAAVTQERYNEEEHERLSKVLAPAFEAFERALKVSSK